MATEELSDVGVLKRSATSGDGAAWGLASICLGAVAILVVPGILILNVILWQSARRPDPLGGVVFLILMLLGIATMLGLAGSGMAFGWKGRRIDRDDPRGSPLATAGLLMGAAAGIGWVIVAIQTLMILFT
jgi:hypothetical protein